MRNILVNQLQETPAGSVVIPIDTCLIKGAFIESGVTRLIISVSAKDTVTIGVRETPKEIIELMEDSEK